MPVVEVLGPQALVKVYGVGVPFEHGPLEAAAATPHRLLRAILEQRIAHLSRAKLWQDKEDFQVEAGQRQEGRIGLKDESVSCHLTVQLGQENLKPRARPGSVGQEACACGLVGRRQLLELGQCHNETGNNLCIVRRGRADCDIRVRSCAWAVGHTIAPGSVDLWRLYIRKDTVL